MRRSPRWWRRPISNAFAASAFSEYCAGGVQLEHPRDERASDRVDVDAPGDAVIDVADVGDAGEVPLLGLLAQPLLHLLAEVIDVVLRHRHADVVHQLVGGPRLGREDRVLLHEVDGDLQVFEGDVIPEVAVEPIGLLDQDDAAGRRRLQERDHLGEAAATGLLGGLDVDELARNGQTRGPAHSSAGASAEPGSKSPHAPDPSMDTRQ